MRFVLVSSPGDGPGSHWSHAAAADLTRVLRVGGASVEWLRVASTTDGMPSAPPGIVVHDVAIREQPLHRVAAAHRDIPLEVALTRTLRTHAAEVVVHVGAGARGSPNVLWVAERMGSAACAVVRFAEVVCHRGTLVDHAGMPCSVHDEPERCRRCCAASWWRAPRSMAFRDRADLLFASLGFANWVFVPTDLERERLAATGVPARVIVATHDPAKIATQLLGAPVAT